MENLKIYGEELPSSVHLFWKTVSMYNAVSLNAVSPVTIDGVRYDELEDKNKAIDIMKTRIEKDRKEIDHHIVYHGKMNVIFKKIYINAKKGNREELGNEFSYLNRLMLKYASLAGMHRNRSKKPFLDLPYCNDGMFNMGSTPYTFQLEFNSERSKENYLNELRDYRERVSMFRENKSSLQKTTLEDLEEKSISLTETGLTSRLNLTKELLSRAGYKA